MRWPLEREAVSWAHDIGHFTETTMGLSMIHEQQKGLDLKSLLFSINNSTKCICSNSHVIFFPSSQQHGV